MWKRILKYLIGAVAIVTLVIGTQVVTAETGLIVKLPKQITNIASELGQSFTLGMVGVAYATTPDYICDGVADDVEIQAAMNALPATGGELFFFGGNYVLTATVTRAINNISIVGSGKSTYFSNDGGTALFSTGAQTGWYFANLRTDGGWITLSDDTGLLNIFNDTQYISSSRTVTYVVASDNANAYTKAQADYICDGTNDQVQIQAAINALPTVGGEILLTEGNFYLADNVSVPAHTKVSGQGRNITIVRATTDLDSIFYTASGQHNHAIVFSDFSINGNAAAGTIVTYPFNLYNFHSNLIENIEITSTNCTIAMYFRAAEVGFYAWLNVVQNCEINLNTVAGFGIGVWSTDNWFIDNDISASGGGSSTGIGLRIAAGGNRFIGEHIDHFNDAIYSSTTDVTVLQNCTMENNDNYGINIQAGGAICNHSITACIGYSNAAEDIYINGQNISITGCILRSTGAAQSIESVVNSDYITVIGNVCAGTIVLVNGNNENAHNIVSH